VHAFAKSIAIGLVLLRCATALDAWASDRKIEAELKRQFHERTLTLRHPLLSGTQQYDSTGKLLTAGPEGAWTLYSGMTIRKIRLQPDKLLLEGYRTYFLYAQQRVVSYVPDKGSSMKVEALLERPCASVEEAAAIIGAIFAVKDEDLLEAVPVYWKPFIAEKTRVKWSDEKTDGTKESPSPVAGTSMPAYTPAPNVTMPKPLYTPEPQFTEQARKYRTQGVVMLKVIVTPDGEVKRVRISRAAGMGLDEAAVAIVRSWKFRPGTKDGKPVPMEMALEISFNLYDRQKHR
jgi:TonB family protein